MADATTDGTIDRPAGLQDPAGDPSLPDPTMPSEPGPPPQSTTGEGKGGDSDKGRGSGTAPSPPIDDLVTTRHTLRTGGRTLRYTATAGRVVLRDEIYEDGVFQGFKPKAEMFVTSYVLDGDDSDSGEAASGEPAEGPAEPSAEESAEKPPAGTGEQSPRPVTFAFNGGPGSSSVWLHMGLLGPRRVVMGDVGELSAPPYALADNAESLLAVSDLVFIDPVSTGYSRAVEGGKPGDYHGYAGDLDSVGELIRLWTARHRRWMSPKLLAGESYGTLRAAALADHLQTRYGMYLNGLILVSSVLDLGSIGMEQPDDRGYVNFLPTYAAVAHYHGKHEDRSLQEVLAEAEAYAARDYPWLLARGNRLTPAERDEAVATVARLTGVSEGYVRRANLRLEHVRFFTELLREEGLDVGRLDARFTGPQATGLAEQYETDPSHAAIAGPYAAAFNHYVRAELDYHNDLHYEQISERVQPWSFKDFEGRAVDVTPRLAKAMRTNPHLQVHIAYGYFDGATPYFAAQDVVAHLAVPDDLAENIEHAYYEAGHMMYVHEPSRLRQSADLADFVTRASAGRRAQRS